MEAVVKQHPAKGKGWAVITLSGDGLPSAGLRFQFRRSAGRDAILGPKGWQATELWLEASETSPAPGGLALTVGPEVVNHMDTANYALLVIGEGIDPKQPLQAGLAWRNIAQHDLGTGKRGGVAVRGETDEAAAARARAAAAAAEQAAKPADAPKPVEPARKTADTAENKDKQAPPRKSNIGLIAAAIAVLLLGGGGVAWWMWPKPPVQQTDADKPKTADTDTKKTEEARKTEESKKELELPKPPDTGDDLPPGADPLKFAREKLQAGLEAPRALALADKLMQRPPAGIDAAFLVYRYAAQKGDANAAFKLARIVDPADETPSGTLKKSPESALEWYRSAAEGKHPEAGASIARLKTWVEKQASTGDAEAQRVLKLFPSAM